MYRNAVIVYRDDRLNLQSDMSFFHATNSVVYGKCIRKAVLFKSGSGNEMETIVYTVQKSTAVRNYLMKMT